MCSTVSERLARIRQAIDELAAESRGTGQPQRGAVPQDTAQGPLQGQVQVQEPATAPEAAPAVSLHDRLARIWLMMAELDPELARRVTHYGGPAH
jgi:hypothetical protein